MAIKAVIDTNILVSALSTRSEHHWVVQSLLNGEIDLFVTTEIMLEYEEVLKQKYSPFVAEYFLLALKELPNVHFTHIYFYWDLLTDADDNKFADCYTAANAEYLVTNDKGFAKLKGMVFPFFNIFTIGEFRSVIQDQ